MHLSPKNAQEHHFARVRDVLRTMILKGDFADGQRIEPETELMRRFKLSRVTIRKALETLKREKILTSTQGSGTSVTLRTSGFAGELNSIVLIAPLDEPFFGQFVRHFEAVSDQHGALVLLRHSAADLPADRPDFYERFLKLNIHDFVIWPSYGFRKTELLPRLRGLGLNLVFFDHVLENRSADCVALDNAHAVTALVSALRPRAGALAAIGWRDVPLSSTNEREAAFRAQMRPEDRFFTISRREEIGRQLDAIVAGLADSRQWPAGFIGLNGEIGTALIPALDAHRAPEMKIGVIDRLGPGLRRPVVCIEQPIERAAETVFECLRRQNSQPESWRPQTFRVRGKLVHVV